jgi:cell division protease FtsH
LFLQKKYCELRFFNDLHFQWYRMNVFRTIFLLLTAYSCFFLSLEAWSFPNPFAKKQEPLSSASALGKFEARVVSADQIKCEFEFDQLVLDLFLKNDFTRYLKTVEEYKQLPAKILPKAILVFGEAGMGKKTLVRAGAKSYNLRILEVFIEDLMLMNAEDLIDLFEQISRAAKSSKAPLVLCVHGLTAGFCKQDTPFVINFSKLLDAYLTDVSNLFFIGTSTDRSLCTSDFLKQNGLVDFYISPLCLEQVAESLLLHVKSIAQETGVSANQEKLDFPYLAKFLCDRSHAYIKNVVKSAFLRTVVDGQDRLQSYCLYAAGEQFDHYGIPVYLSLEREYWLRISRHEVGHAMVLFVLKNVLERRLATINLGARAKSACLGMTLALPNDNCVVGTRDSLVARIAVYLGGAESEKAFYSSFGCGCCSDLEQSRGLAEFMVCDLAMSDFYPRTYERKCCKKLPGWVDDEVDKILQEAQKMAEKIIAENKEKINFIAESLLEKWFLNAAEFSSLCEQFDKEQQAT